MLHLTVARRTHTPRGYPEARPCAWAGARYPRRVTTTQDRRDHDVIEGPVGAEETSARLAPAAAIDAPADVPEARLRDNRDFLVVLFGQGISSFGDSITNTALPLLVLALTGSGLAMGVVGVLTTLPDLILGLPAGAYADRWEPAHDDVRRRPRAVRAHRHDPGLGRARRPDARRHPRRHVPAELAARPVARRLHRGRAGPRRPRRGAARQRDLRGGVQRRLDRRARRSPACSPPRSAPARRSPSTPSRSCSRPARCCSSGRPLRAEARTVETHILADIREGVAYVLGSRRCGRASRCGRRRR